MVENLRKGYLLQISSANFNHVERILGSTTWGILCVIVSIANLKGVEDLPTSWRLSNIL